MSFSFSPVSPNLCQMLVKLAAVVGIAIGLFVGVRAGASGSGSTSGLACSASVSGQQVSVTVTGMRTSSHVLYMASLDGTDYSQTDLAPWPPPDAYTYAFTVPGPGTYSVSVTIEKGEGNLKAGPGGWTFYGVQTVPNLCTVAAA